MRHKGQSGPTPIAAGPKTVPVKGDNIFWRKDPTMQPGKALGIRENYHYPYVNERFTISGYMKVPSNQVITASVNIYSGNWYDANKKFISRWPSYTNRNVSPPNAAFLLVGVETNNLDRLAIFVGDWGQAGRLVRPEPYPPAWHQVRVLPAAKSRNNSSIKYEGYLGSTTKDPRFSLYPESGFNFYRDADDSNFGMVMAKGYGENSPILVVHPWNAINERRAIHVDINSECTGVASNGEQVFAILNNNNRLTLCQKYIGVFDVRTQNPYQINGGHDVQGYGNDEGLKKVMAYESHQIPDPGNGDVWRKKRDAFISSWRNTGIAAEKGANKLVAVSCATANRIQLRRFPSDAILQTLSVSSPRWMDFTPDGALWVVSLPNPDSNPALRTNSKLIKFVNQGTTAAPKFTQVLSRDIPFLASIMREADNGVTVGISGTVQQYHRLNSAGILVKPHGTLGGNFTSCVVTPTTYCLLNREPLQDGDWNDNTAFSARAPDGSIWLGNPGNFEVQHWSADMSKHYAADRIGYLADFFQLALDRAPSQEKYVYGEMYRFKGDWSKGPRSFQIDRNYSCVLPSNLLPPHSVQTYTSKDGLRRTTIGLFQDTDFNAPDAPRYPGNPPKWPGYQCEIVKLPAVGAPVRKGEWVDFEPYTGRTWNLYPEGMRTFKVVFKEGVGWFTEVWFRPYLDLAVGGEEWPLFGPEKLLLRELTQTLAQASTRPLPQPGWNRMFTCPQLPNGAFPGMETAYQKLGGFHLGAVKKGTPGWLWLALPNAKMRRGNLVPGVFPDKGSDPVFGGHFVAGLDVAGSFVYVGQDGQFSDVMANQTLVFDQDGKYVTQFGRLQDNGPGFNSSNMDPYEYANNTGKIAVRKLANGDHIILRTSENGGGFLVHRHVKPTLVRP